MKTTFSACQQCHDQKYIIVPKGRYAVAELCQCSRYCPQCDNIGFQIVTDSMNRDTAKRCSCYDLKQSIELYNLAHIPNNFYHAIFDNNRIPSNEKLREAFKITQTLIEEEVPLRKKGLLYYGKPGSGKTWLAVALLHGLIFKHQIPSRFIEFTNLLSQIKHGYDQGQSEAALIDSFINVEVLMIDELGKGRQSDWELNILDIIISQRYNSNKMTIFTTNYTNNRNTTYTEKYPAKKTAGNTDELILQLTLEERVHSRIFSRLKEMCDFCEMPDTDRRTKTEVIV